MVSKEGSKNSGFSLRNACRRSATSASLGIIPEDTCASSQARKFALATASRSWARRAPSISTEFFFAFSSKTGQAMGRASTPCSNIHCQLAALVFCGSKATFLSRQDPSADSRSSGLASVTPYPTCACQVSTGIRLGSTNHVRSPFAVIRAWLCRIGSLPISLPRTFKSQETDSGINTHKASRPLPLKSCPIRLRLDSEDSPEQLSGCKEPGFATGAGRSDQTESTKFSEVDTHSIELMSDFQFANCAWLTVLVSTEIRLLGSQAEVIQ